MHVRELSAPNAAYIIIFSVFVVSTAGAVMRPDDRPDVPPPEKTAAAGQISEPNHTPAQTARTDSMRMSDVESIERLRRDVFSRGVNDTVEIRAATQVIAKHLNHIGFNSSVAEQLSPYFLKRTLAHLDSVAILRKGLRSAGGTVPLQLVRWQSRVDIYEHIDRERGMRAATPEQNQIRVLQIKALLGELGFGPAMSGTLSVQLASENPGQIQTCRFLERVVMLSGSGDPLARLGVDPRAQRGAGALEGSGKLSPADSALEAAERVEK